jgi:hypothetical protein
MFLDRSLFTITIHANAKLKCPFYIGVHKFVSALIMLNVNCAGVSNAATTNVIFSCLLWALSLDQYQHIYLTFFKFNVGAWLFCCGLKTFIMLLVHINKITYPYVKGTLMFRRLCVCLCIQLYVSVLDLSSFSLCCRQWIRHKLATPNGCLFQHILFSALVYCKHCRIRSKGKIVICVPIFLFLYLHKLYVYICVCVCVCACFLFIRFFLRRWFF